MLKVNDKVKVKYGAYEGLEGTVISIHKGYIPPVVVGLNGITSTTYRFFYEEDLKVLDK